MNNNMTGNINYELTPSGKCPVCKTRLKIVDPEGSLYKAGSFKIDPEWSKVELKCPVCKRILLIRK